MSLGILALICACGLIGPLLSAAAPGTIPLVVGEILAGLVIGTTGFGLIDTSNATLSFLSDVGFLMLMFAVGMSVPLHDNRLRAALGSGATAALLTGLLGIGAGIMAAKIGGGHPAVYAVILASGSAAVALPIIQGRNLTGPVVLAVTAWVTVIDIAATVAIPFVLRPSRALHTALGTLLVALCVAVILAAVVLLQREKLVKTMRRLSAKYRWALDLRVALTVLIGLAWIAQSIGASLLIAGFGTGLVVARAGGPERLSTEVRGIAQGFFIPLFFVVLGARLDLRDLVNEPRALELAGVLAGLNVAVHVVAGRLARLPWSSGLLSGAQLGVPAAVIALGLPAGAVTQAQASAIFAAALVSIGVCSVGASIIGRTASGRGSKPNSRPAAATS